MVIVCTYVEIEKKSGRKLRKIQDFDDITGITPNATPQHTITNPVLLTLPSKTNTSHEIPRFFLEIFSRAYPYAFQ